MTTTVTTPPATRPAQVTGNPQAFDAAKADWQAWMQTAVPQLNTQSAEVDTSLNLCSGYADSAGESATTTTTAAQAALAGANFKGAWSSLTGALNTPATVQHNGQVWLLTANLANVTTATPGVSSSWAPYSAVHPIDRADLAGVVQPTLDLNFAEQSYRVYDAAAGGLQSVALSSILTYTGSGRTYTDALGILRAQASNTPRIEFDPITGAGLGLSVWGARTNLLTRSNEFDNSAWIKGATTVTANAATAPDGTLTANEFKEDSANAAHSITQSQTITSGTTYTYSVYAKEMPTGAKRYLSVSLSSVVFGANMRVTVDLATGSSVPLNSPLATSVQALGNGWWRISITALATATATGSNLVSLRLFNAAVDTLASYTGDGTSGLYVWGAQLEAGSVPSPYIPTTTSAVTAPVDVAQITGANFSKWYRKDEGTFVVFGSLADITAPSLRLFCADAGATTSNIRSTGTFQVIDAAGAVQCNLSAATLVNNVPAKLAAAYKANDFAVSANGGTALTDASGTVPTVDRLTLLASSTAAPTGGILSRILYFPRRLSNATLQALSAI